MMRSIFFKEGGIHMKKKTVVIMINAAMIFYISVLIIFTISKIGSYYNKYKINHIGNIGFIIADSDHDVVIDAGDIVLVDLADFTLKEGDVAAYKDGDSIKFDVIDSVADGTVSMQNRGNAIKSDYIAGRYLFSIPLLGYAFSFKTAPVLSIVCIIVPSVLIFYYILTLLADGMIDRRTHRKKIMRRKDRRRIRYKKEGADFNKKAAI
jgi:hypothetical protein